MCLIAGGISKSGDIKEHLIRMIEAGKHRGPDSFGAWVDGKVIYSRDFGDVGLIPSGRVGLAHCRLGITGDHPQPLLGRFPLVHNGEIYNYRVLRRWLENKGAEFSTDVDSEVIMRLLEYMIYSEGREIREAVRFAMKVINGDYAVAFSIKGSIYVFRDPMGTRPLYYSRNGYFASERKVLWAIGEEAIPVRPGELVELKAGKTSKERLASLFNLDGRKIRNMERAERCVEASLRNSTRLRSVEKMGILFSGGLDSTVIAAIASQYSNVTLYVAGTEDSHDVRMAESVSEELGLKLRIAKFTCEDVEEAMKRVMLAIEEPDPLNLSVGIPIYFATRRAKEDGIRVLLSGQGADELFGGYEKYTRNPMLMKSDLTALGDRNLIRDDKIGMLNNVECRFPFIDLGVVGVALRLPLEMKVLGEDRKIILRRVARRMGLPKEATEAGKKAAQYGSGASKCLKRIAKGRGMSLKELAIQLFRGTFRDQSE